MLLHSHFLFTMAVLFSPIDQLCVNWLDILKLSIPAFISLPQKMHFTLLGFGSNSREVSFPWHCGCSWNCDENSVPLILTVWCLLLEMVVLDFGFKMYLSIVPYLAAVALLWNQTLLVVFCEAAAEKGKTRVFIFLWVVWTDGRVWLTWPMTHESDLHLFDLKVHVMLGTQTPSHD